MINKNRLILILIFCVIAFKLFSISEISYLENSLNGLVQESLIANFFRAKYPKIFEYIPQEYFKDLYEEIKNATENDLNSANSEDLKAEIFIWNILGKRNNIELEAIWPQGGYLYFLPKKVKGVTKSYQCFELRLATKDLKNLDVKIRAHAKQKLEEFAGNYKIHLMPEQKYMTYIVVQLMNAIETDPQLAAALTLFKIVSKPNLTKTINISQLPEEQRFPRIVIYPSTGKENAQLVLDKIVNLFKNDIDKGINVTPRYNQRINDLVYYAQGDADCKKQIEYQWYFEEPNMIHYKADLTGEKRDYKLKYIETPHAKPETSEGFVLL